MKKQWQSLVILCMAWMAFAAPAAAVPVVVADTTYTLYLQRAGSDNLAFAIFRFDETPEETLYENGNVRVTESETAIDAVSSRITIRISGDFDLFPETGDLALLGIGTGDDGLDLLFPVRLTDARISFFEQDGDLVDITDNLVSDTDQTDPWDGTFPNPFELFGIEDIGNRNVQAISIDFIVSTQAEVPEPGIPLLAGAGLLAFAAARRLKAGAKRP